MTEAEPQKSNRETSFMIFVAGQLKQNSLEQVEATVKNVAYLLARTH